MAAAAPNTAAAEARYRALYDEQVSDRGWMGCVGGWGGDPGRWDLRGPCTHAPLTMFHHHIPMHR